MSCVFPHGTSTLLLASRDGPPFPSDSATRETVAELAQLIAWGEIVMPLDAIYPFAELHDAYADLARRKAVGKIVLAFNPKIAEPLRPPAVNR